MTDSDASTEETRTCSANMRSGRAKAHCCIPVGTFGIKRAIGMGHFHARMRRKNALGFIAPLYLCQAWALLNDDVMQEDLFRHLWPGCTKGD